MAVHCGLEDRFCGRSTGICDQLFETPQATRGVSISPSALIILILISSGETLNAGSTDAAQKKKDGLYPLQALVQPITARFKYHFEGKRETNRLDKVNPFTLHTSMTN